MNCTPGKFAINGATTCESCEKGKYSSAPSSSACQDCAHGFFNELAASTSCTACPKGEESDQFSTGCVCGAGSYSAASFPVPPVSCDTGSSCGVCLTIIDPEECPLDGDIADCSSVGYGELCEGDGECGTDSYLDNCGGYDIYL